MENNDFLGRGWSFPPRFDKATKSVALVEGAHDVKKSLEVLLTTRLGERILHPDYGSNVFLSQFHSIGPSLKHDITEQIASAISQYEHRVILDDVQLVPLEQEGQAEIHISYTLSELNKSENLVFPFYLESP